MKCIDLFCGCGGLSLGFEMNGFEICKAFDFNAAAIETYNKNLKYKCGEVKDLTTLDAEYFNEFPKIDGIIGGPPCQGFSTAGHRDPNDVRNKLYEEYFKILGKLSPKFFVFENVVGILTFAKGAVIKDIFARADKMGYYVYDSILNAVDYGVPQFRRRVIFVGIKKDEMLKNGDFVFPVPFHKQYLTTEDALSDLPEVIIKEQPDKVKYKTDCQNEYQKKMRGDCKIVTNHNFTNHSDKTIETIKLVPEGGSIKDLTPEQRGNRNYHALLRKMDHSKPSLTIDTGHRTYFHYSQPRIPSIREEARLQSFPDYFEFLGSKVEQYKQVGNAVPPLLASEISKAIKSYFIGE